MPDRYGHPRQSVFAPGRRHASATASVAYSTTTATQHNQQQQQLPPPAPAGKLPRSPLQQQQQQSLQFQSSSTTSRGGGGGGVHTRRRAPGARRGADGETLVVEDYSADEEGEDDGEDDGGDDGGIVVRDANGEYEVEEPPSMVVDDPDEIVLDMRQENEKERQRLADAVKEHQSRQRSSVPAQPEELLETVKASLRAKVSALLEDNWMYEEEEVPRPM